MKIGQKVWACDDGKWKRRESGIVVGTKNGYQIKIKLLEGDNAGVEFWARKRSAIRYCLIKGTKYFKTIRQKKYVDYSGWDKKGGESLDWCSSWYTIYKRKDNLNKDGYVIYSAKKTLKEERLRKKRKRVNKRNNSSLPRKFKSRVKKYFNDLSLFDKHIYLKVKFNTKKYKK